MRVCAPLVLLLCIPWRAGYPQQLPQIDTAHFLPAIRAQIEQADAAARANPRDSNAAGVLAMTLHAYQQYDAAAQAYAAANLLDPGKFDWLYLLGAVQIERGEFEAAAAAFRSALGLQPGSLTAQVRLAQSLASAARSEEAGEVYRQILQKHADCPQAWYGLGRVQAAAGDFAAAARSYTKACDLFPHYGAAHFALASALRRLGRQTEAQQHLAAYSKCDTVEPPLEDPLFERIHSLNHSAQAHLQQGAELDKAGRLEDAVREHEAALAADPANVQAHVNLISLCARTGDTAGAKRHFEAAIRLNPGRSDAWYNYGVLLLRERQDAEAHQAFQRALAINPDYAEAHGNLGTIYEQQGRLDDAAGEFRAALAARPDYPLARFHLGRILANRQDYSGAIQQFLKALQPEDSQTTVYLYALAATYARAGDRESALRYFQKARAAAIARGQSQLLASIDRDLKTLGAPQ